MAGTAGLYNDPEYLNNIVNQKFGKLTVLSFDHFETCKKIQKGRKSPRRNAIYKCKCDCGNIIYLPINLLVQGRTRSCGCSVTTNTSFVGGLSGKLSDPNYLNEIVGKKFNRLTVLKFDHFKYNKPTKNNYIEKVPFYLCKCDCGNTTILSRTAIQTGATKSCGCLSRERSTTHNDSKSRLYGIYRGMRKRCYGKTNGSYHNYGGRGIYICDEWKGRNATEGYLKFKEWSLSNGYADDLTIDRIDNDGPYAPWNCRWVSNDVQAWNKRTTLLIYPSDKNSTIQNIMKTIPNTAPELTLRDRFSNRGANKFFGWSENDKLFIPPRYKREKYRDDNNIKDVFEFDRTSPYNQQNATINCNGMDINIQELKELSNSELSASVLYRRFLPQYSEEYKSWSDNDKLFIPSEYGRNKYRKDHDIKDVFTFDKDSTYDPNRKE